LSATIVITSWNNPEGLRRAYESAASQTWQDLQIIIADDASSDPEVTRTLTDFPNDPNLVVFNSGVSDEDRPKTARYATQINTAVRMFATGKYLFFLPDDDWFAPRKVQEHVLAMFPRDLDVTYSSQEIVSDGRKIGERIARDVVADAYNVVDHGQVCVSRAAFDSVGGWPDDPAFWSGADAYFWLRLTTKGYKFWPVPEVLCTKSVRDGVQSKIFSGRNPWQ